MPLSMIMWRASCVAFCRSFEAPVVTSFDDLLSHAAAEHPSQVVFVVGEGGEMAVLVWELPGEPAGAAAGDDGDFVHRVGIGQDVGHNGVTGLVKGSDFLLLRV